MDKNKGIMLLIVNEGTLTHINSQALGTWGYKIYTTSTLAEARRLLSVVVPDVIMLDMFLLDGSGYDFCNEVRDTTSAHIIFLASMSDTAMNNNDDTYIAKTVHSIEENIVKAPAAVKRSKTDIKNVHLIQKDKLIFNVVTMQVFVDDKLLELTPYEYSLLLLLAENEGAVISADQICETVWKVPLMGNKGALQTAISRLRQKIEPLGYVIVAQRGKGYLFEKDY